jgi:hypothetical protein
MDEKEWLACTDSGKMFKVFGGAFGKMRLDARLRRFAVECCRRVRHLITEEMFLAAADAGEAVAEDPGNEKGTCRVMGAAYIHGRRRERQYAITAEPHRLHAARAAIATCGSTDWHAAVNAMREAAQAMNVTRPDRCDPADLRHQSALLRDLFGNPFHPVVLDPAWRTPAVLALAQAAYDHRFLPSGYLDCQRLAVLADALEEGGCDNVEILSHLHNNDPHWRGCWALDTILGKS